jgi:enamine deaminase RidA (YjgF/YER057c/UK114 family)
LSNALGDPGSAIGNGTWLPGPTARRAAYFIHTGTLYPLATAGLVDAGQSPIERQSEEVFDRLEALLAEHSSDLTRVVRCEVMLASAADFYEFNVVWRRRFPEDPPARWLIGVGDTHPVPGARVALHAIALAGDSEHEKQLVRCADTPDTLAAEHCAQAIRAGDYVFPSPVAAIEDYERGIEQSENPLQAQAAYEITKVMERNERLLQEAGTSLGNTVKTQNVMSDLADWVHINPIWGQFMGKPAPPRTSVSVDSTIVPGARPLPNLTAVVTSDGNVKEELTKGVPFAVTKHGYNFSAAVRTNEYVSLAGHLSYDYSKLEFRGASRTMPHLESDIEIQTQYVMEDRLAILEANGLGPESVCEAKVYLKSPRQDLWGFRRAWERWYPDGDGPVVQLIPVTGIHFAGTIIEIELLAAAKQ